jgi:hypothetical protein
MSTQTVTPQLSPIEQLMGSQPQAQAQPNTQPQGQSDLSPIEKLMVTPPNSIPTGDSDYLKKVNTGPDSPAGQAEKAMGETFGDNKAQLHQALKSTGQAALATAGGVIGAPAASMSLDAAAPLVTTLAEHLPTLDKAYKILTAIGAGSYTVQHLKDVMKIIGGGK